MVPFNTVKRRNLLNILQQHDERSDWAADKEALSKWLPLLIVVARPYILLIRLY